MKTFLALLRGDDVRNSRFLAVCTDPRMVRLFGKLLAGEKFKKYHRPNKLKLLRQKLGLSQSNIANMIFISQARYSQIERTGACTPKEMEALAEILGASAGEMFHAD